MVILSQSGDIISPHPWYLSAFPPAVPCTVFITTYEPFINWTQSELLIVSTVFHPNISIFPFILCAHICLSYAVAHL